MSEKCSVCKNDLTVNSFYCEICGTKTNLDPNNFEPIEEQEVDKEKLVNGTKQWAYNCFDCHGNTEIKGDREYCPSCKSYLPDSVCSKCGDEMCPVPAWQYPVEYRCSLCDPPYFDDRVG